MHGIVFPDAALLVITDGSEIPCEIQVSQSDYLFLELPIVLAPDDQWSRIHITTSQCFLVFSVKYADSRLLPEN